MRPGSDALKAVLDSPSSFGRALVGDVVRGAERRIQDLPLTSWTLSEDIGAKIKSGGSVDVVYTDDFAASVTPHELTDALAPYGSELHLYVVISAGEFSERVPVGKFRIDGVPKASDAQMRFRDRVITVGSRVQLRLLDRFMAVDRAQFRSLEQPPDLSSAWAELARVMRLQVTRTGVADQAIPETLVYPRNRVDAAQLLAKILGGRAYMKDDGTVGILPTVPGSPVARLALGADGTVGDVEYSMESEGVFNVIFGDFEAEDGTPIHVEATVHDGGPLDVSGPYGEYVGEYSRGNKDLINTLAAAQAAVDEELLEASSTESYELPVQCQFNPLLEIGDVVEVERMDRLITGRILKVTRGQAGPMSLRLDVLDDVAN